MTTPKTRLKKPAVARTRPLRSASRILRAPAKPANAARRSPAWIDRSIDAGYSLVDEYVRAGRNAAERIRSSSPEPSASRSPAPGMLAEYASDFVQVGFELLQALLAPAEQPAPTGAAGPFSTPRAAHTPGAARAARGAYRLVVETSRRVQVSFELRSDAAESALRAERPRSKSLAARGSQSTLSVAVEAQTRTIRVRVAANAAAGTYRSLLVGSADNLPKGSVELKILPKASR